MDNLFNEIVKIKGKSKCFTSYLCESRKQVEYHTIWHLISILAVMCSADPNRIVDILTEYLFDEKEAQGIKDAGK